MKKIIVMCFLSVWSISFGQNDKFNFNIGASVSLVPVTLQGPKEINYGGGETTIDQYIVPIEPEYEHKKMFAGFANIGLQFGFHIPCYKTDKWSLGLKLNAGVGIAKGFLTFEDYNLISFDFPQFVYLRKQFERKDVSFLLGYKKCFLWMPYGVPLAGIDFNLDDGKNAVRFYTTLYRQRYYTQYTNGDMIPSIKIGEINISFIHSFGK